MTPELKCNGTHDEPPCGAPDCWAREDPPGLNAAIDIAGLVDPWPMATPQAATGAPDAMAVLTELKIEVLPGAKDDDIALVSVGALLKLAARAPQAAEPHPSWIDDKALEVARRFTLDTEPQRRAALQCAVIDAMLFARPDRRRQISLAPQTGEQAP